MFESKELLFFAGFLLVFLGILIVSFALFLENVGFEKEDRDNISEGNSEFAGLVMIGPFPIAFGTNEKVVQFLIILGIIFAVLFYLMPFVLKLFLK